MGLPWPPNQYDGMGYLVFLAHKSHTYQERHRWNCATTCSMRPSWKWPGFGFGGLVRTDSRAPSLGHLLRIYRCMTPPYIGSLHNVIIWNIFRVVCTVLSIWEMGCERRLEKTSPRINISYRLWKHSLNMAPFIRYHGLEYLFCFAFTNVMYSILLLLTRARHVIRTLLRNQIWISFHVFCWYFCSSNEIYLWIFDIYTYTYIYTYYSNTDTLYIPLLWSILIHTCR